MLNFRPNSPSCPVSRTSEARGLWPFVWDACGACDEDLMGHGPGCDVTTSPGVQTTWNPLEPPSESSSGRLAIDIAWLPHYPLEPSCLNTHTHTHIAVASVFCEYTEMIQFVGTLPNTLLTQNDQIREMTISFGNFVEMTIFFGNFVRDFWWHFQMVVSRGI